MDRDTDSLCSSVRLLEMGGLVWAPIIFMEGRWESALAGRTGTWLSRARPSPATVGWSHGLAVLWGKHNPTAHYDTQTHRHTQGRLKALLKHASHQRHTPILAPALFVVLPRPYICVCVCVCSLV